MKNPVRGIFKVTGFYDVRSSTKLTGVITAPGIPAAAAPPERGSQDSTVRASVVPASVVRASTTPPQ
jgi:hypothetical protein